MPIRRLKAFLDQHHVPYRCLFHPAAYTTQQISQAAHISGKTMVKVVMVKLDGAMAMAVVPAAYRVDLGHLAKAAGATRAKLASEEEFQALFPDVELGAMPPFGNLYGLPVYVSEDLTDKAEIAFNAGTHSEVIQLAYADFARLVQPEVLRYSTHELLVEVGMA